MISTTLQQVTIPDSDIVVTVIEEVLRLEPRQAFYSAYAMGSDPKTGEFFRKSFCRAPAEKPARYAANGFWVTYSKRVRQFRKA